MKKNLGKLGLIFLLSVNLFAYEWTSHISKEEVFLNDSIYLKYQCTFEDKGELYTIDFYPKADSKVFDLTLLSRNEKIFHGKKTVIYEYIAKLKKVGEVVFDFTAHMKKTTLESIVYTSGSRDDDKGDTNFILESIHLEKLKVKVKENTTPLIGVFTLAIKHDEKEVKAYEPYHVDVTISGVGNFHDIQAITYNIKDVKVFSQKPIKNLTLSEDGLSGQWNQKFAFIGSSDFVIPSVDIRYYNKKSSSLETLHLPSAKVKVSEAYKKEDLLDAVEEPMKIHFEYIYYVLTFISGFFIAKIRFKREKMSSREEVFREKILRVKSSNELSILLILHNQTLFQDIITDLESAGAISLSKAKKKAIQIQKR